MAILFGILLLFLGVAVFYYGFRLLITREASWGWWTAMLLASGVGVIVGYWAGFSCIYSVSEELRIASFPVPCAFLVLEEGTDDQFRWIDYIVPLAPVIAFSNSVFLASLFVLPAWAAFFIATHGKNHE